MHLVAHRHAHRAVAQTAVLIVLSALAGCPTPIGRPQDAGPRNDAMALRFDAPGLDAFGADSSIHAMVVPEVCTNGIDEDRNGSIDDGCPCAVGTQRACWPGAPDYRRIGACTDGAQRCDSDGAAATWSECMGATLPTREIRDDGTDNNCDGATDEAGGICVPSEQQERTCDDGSDSDCDTAIDCDDPDCHMSPSCSMRCAAEETVCWGEVDDDCDGRIDCEDSDCASDVSCRSETDCGPGNVQTYRQRVLDPTRGASSIAMGDGAPPMTNGCEPGSCPTGQVRVVLPGGMSSCVPPPPMCPAGEYANYAGYSRWICTPPCEVIIHYGGLFGGLNVCTGRPPMTMCPVGETQTFVFETETWTCRPTCSNTTYDQVILDGEVVCIPC